MLELYGSFGLDILTTVGSETTPVGAAAQAVEQRKWGMEEDPVVYGLRIRHTDARGEVMIIESKFIRM